MQPADVRPPRPDTRLPGAALAWLAGSGVVGALALTAIVAVAREEEGPVPPTVMFAAAGIVMAVVSSIAIVAAARSEQLPTRVAVALAAGFTCVAIVKFALAPSAFYEQNQQESIQTLAGDSPDGMIVVGIALAVAAIYLLALMLIAIAFRERSGASDGIPGAFALIATIGVNVLLIGITAFIAGSTVYLDFVFEATNTTATFILLVAAFILVAAGFRSSAREAGDTGRAAIYVSTFWLAVAIVVLFHALWIVFLLAIVTIWPLKTVVPK